MKYCAVRDDAGILFLFSAQFSNDGEKRDNSSSDHGILENKSSFLRAIWTSSWLFYRAKLAPENTKNAKVYLVLEILRYTGLLRST